MSNETAVRLPQQRSAPSGQSAEPREHRFDVDLMRLICSATVMLGHVGAQFIVSTGNDPANGAGSYWAGHVAEALNPFAVPMYFAIAGWAVLVGAPPRDSDRMWKRLVRNTVPMFAWTAIYLVWAWLRNRNDEPMTELAVDSLFASVQPAYHLWFMYTYIPIIALLAFAMLIRAGQRPYRLGAVLLGIAVLPSVLDTLAELTGREMPSVAWGFGTYSLVYAVGGALLFALPARSGRWRLPLLVVLPLTMAGSLWYNTQVHYVMPNAHLFVALMAICVLLLISRIRIPEKRRPLLKKLAGAALGAYMVHVLFVEEIVRPLVSPDLSGPVAGLLLAGLLAVVLTLSFATSLLWGKLNLRRLLG
ncbi:acyltransferase [Streptomyces poonensis]|uniref:Membrane protein n=1 Tax=Streptomyces poonensis TaxID=68255 RepID=A0A918P8G1_9ACTN|nr:acyltransferase [Streptomyces poonensis]GGY91950.1 membrane protein [Streptomyces poonensis]GLJ87763.1 membrane protein [Streptomyces poonensis]